MKIYLDIDGVLLDYNNGGVADGAVELIEYVTKEFDCYWLTTHCKGAPTTAVRYLQEYFSNDTMELLKKVKATDWTDMKTEGIDFDSNFIWLDDYPFQAEMAVLENFGTSFSPRRVLGIDNVKRRIARSTGIPTTKQGIERKIGKTVIRGIGKLLK